MKVKRHQNKSSLSSSDPSVRKLYELPQWLWQAVVDSLPSNVAILDESGIILYVNKAWRLFANEERLNAQGLEEGKNYLDFCRMMFGKNSSEVDAIAASLRQVMRKELGEICLEFALPPPSKYLWYEIRLLRLDPPNSRDTFKVLALHSEITAQKQAEERLQELRGHLIGAQEQERQRIARELHDELNQQMAMLSIELEQLGQHLPKSAVDLHRRTQELWAHAHEIVADVQRFSYRLHPSNLDTLGLVAAVKSLCREVSERQVLDVEFFHRGVPGAIHKDVELCLFRIVQEALSNAIKHSGAQWAKVELIGSPKGIHLSITDSGVGFCLEDVREKSGLGLVSMQERLRLIGGELSIESQPGHGTRIEARVA